MAVDETLSVIVSPRGLVAFAESDDEQTVVWVRGEHDVSTSIELAEMMARAIDGDDDDVIVDLSAVSFMSAATIGVIIQARELLRLRTRTLVLRAPSTCARRVIDLCGLAGLIAHATVAPPPALGTWVAVPTAGRADDPAAAPSEPPAEVAAAVTAPAPEHEAMIISLRRGP